MKSVLSRFIPLVLLGSTFAAPTWAQTPDTNAPAATAPAPAKAKVPNLPDTMPKTDPTAAVSRKGQWEVRALANIAKGKAEADSIDMIFDGDSITDFFQTRGKDVMAAHFGKEHIFDFAISGDKTESVIWRLAHGQADGMKPKLIALMIGTNNMRSMNTPAEIAAGVQTIITAYQKKCPDAVILLEAIFPRGHLATDPYRAKIKATNEILAKMADDTKVVYLDFGDKFLTPDGTLEGAIMPDMLHPSPKGYEIWAAAIQPIVDKYCAAAK